ncbi:MAG TPA: non-heme iron oxygenase ferredoxin subunit [Actinomycetota bacterium]|nr:non-heme iron oxygenase ferredoxin subunit [Actinomycetota bacterium]
MTLTTLGRVGDVPEGEVRRFDVGGHAIAVVNLGGGEFRAVGDVCSHAEAYLHEGDVDVEDRTVECPRHGSVFDLDSGAPKTLPATVPVPTYMLTIEDDEIKVEL